MPNEPQLLLTNADLLDVSAGRVIANVSLRVAGGLITEISQGLISKGNERVIDLKTRTLMPGLIDAHVHILGELAATPTLPATFQSIMGAQRLKRMLRRGFTTVRDAGGADAGYKLAVERRAIQGPRLFISGHALSQTGGHGDLRSPFDLSDPCGCHLHSGFGRVADGVPAVLQATRDEIRTGADQIKIVASGGVGSAGGSLHTMQFSDEEISAIVDEARRSNLYVMAHVYSAEGVKRLVRLGIRTIEHGNLIDEEAAKAIADKGAYLVPNLVAYRSIAKYGEAQGYPAAGLARLGEILAAGARSIEIASAAGVKIGYGSDLVKDPESQSEEFLIRSDVQPPLDIIRSATLVGAEIVRMQGKLGVLKEGSIADILAVDGNPLEDLKLLTEQGTHISMIIKDGYIEKDVLTGTAAPEA
jgi:imidazolonepropionase-like amidohydrolase